MPVIHIMMTVGRSKEQKAKLARRFTDDMVEILGVNQDAVQITFHELPRENFARSGLLLPDRQK
jgi:4-oxalocrotonate tautomerase family enzyme